MNEKIEVPLSRTKIALLATGASMFVVSGVLFVLNPEQFVTRVLPSQEMIRLVGIAAIVFFGICLIFITRKLFDNSTGLIIDHRGITDNSNAINVGLIEWDDITGIEILRIASAQILMLQTDEPYKYIDRAKNGVSKRAMKANHRMYGSPLSIISGSLRIKFDDLEKLIRAEFEKKKDERSLTKNPWNSALET